MKKLVLIACLFLLVGCRDSIPTGVVCPCTVTGVEEVYRKSAYFYKITVTGVPLYWGTGDAFTFYAVSPYPMYKIGDIVLL